LFLGKWN